MTWRAEGDVNEKGEETIYFGTRQTMGDMKLSLHPKWWGYGYTGEFAAARGLDSRNRHISEYDPRSREVAPGWARAAVAVSPSTYFSSRLPVKRSKLVRSYAAPALPLHREWHLFLGEPGVSTPPLVGAIDVGRMVFPSGRMLWIVGADVTLQPSTEQLVSRAAEEICRDPAADWAIASGDRDGVPFFVDLADLRRDPN